MGEQTKYPRTFHLPTSPGATSDDRRASDTSGLVGELVVTEKMDGGNITLTRSGFHARSLDGRTNPWDDEAKRRWAEVRWGIPEGWRISAESLAAQRSVRYEDLPDALLVFGVWDENDWLVDWDATTELVAELGLHLVPVLYRGDSLSDALSAWSQAREEQTSEGYVVRCAEAVRPERWSVEVAKWVRTDHVRTEAAWRQRNDFNRNGIRR